jgi:very-short-patch-repair endonuclease
MNRRHHRVDPQLLEFAREMRRIPAPAEEKLWKCLRNRQLGGFKFRRQSAIATYIADFCCPECKLIVELDGESHEMQYEYDQERSQALGEQGFDVIRFPNTEIQENLEGVLLEILRECESRSPRVGPSPLPSPPSTGERE